MTNDRPPRSGSNRAPLSGRDVAGAGAFLLSVNLVCAAVGAGLGALLGALVPLFLAGFLIGFLAGVFFVTKRFRDV